MNRTRRKSRDETSEADAVAPNDVAKDPAAQALGSKGGKKRAERLTAQRRSEIARLAASARWSQKGSASVDHKDDDKR